MKTKLKNLEKIFYCDTDNNKVVEVLWWNWSSRCSEPELDLVTPNLSLADSKDGTRLRDEDIMRVDVKKLFKSKKEAILYLSPDQEQLSNSKTDE